MSSYAGSQYYDPHAILAEETKIPITYKYGCALGSRIFDWEIDDEHADQAQDVPHTDIPPQARTEVSLWMVPTLASQSLIEPGLPPFYLEHRRRELAADPESVPLFSICPYFFEAGYRLNSLILENDTGGNKLLGQFLHDEFYSRFQAMHRSLCRAESELARDPKNAASIHDKTNIPERMTVEERHIWDMYQREVEAFTRWRGFGPGGSKPNAAARKRKMG